MIYLFALAYITTVYPIDPPSHRMLIESSDLIVWAKIEKTEFNTDTTGCTAYLEVLESIYTNHEHGKYISLDYNCLDVCDWPANFQKGEKALVYIKKLKSGKYYVNYLSFGVQYPSEQEYQKVKARIIDYWTNAKDEKGKVDWILKGLEDEIFVNDVKHEFRLYHWERKNKRKTWRYLDLYQLIDESQFERIKECIPKYFTGGDLSIDLLTHFYQGESGIKRLIIKKIKYYRDSRHKHMAKHYIKVLNAFDSTSEQTEIEQILISKKAKELSDEQKVSLINRFLKTVE